METLWKIRFSKPQATHPVPPYISSSRIIHIRSTVRRTALFHPMQHRIDRHHGTSVQWQEKGVLSPSILTASSSIERGCPKN